MHPVQSRNRIVRDGGVQATVRDGLSKTFEMSGFFARRRAIDFTAWGRKNLATRRRDDFSARAGDECAVFTAAALIAVDIEFGFFGGFTGIIAKLDAVFFGIPFIEFLCGSCLDTNGNGKNTSQAQNQFSDHGISP